jgi:hypothetical protein
MVGFVIDARKLGMKSNIARLTKASYLMYPQSNLIPVTCLIRVPMV